jgi:hypothetical protein
VLLIIIVHIHSQSISLLIVLRVIIPMQTNPCTDLLLALIPEATRVASSQLRTGIVIRRKLLLFVAVLSVLLLHELSQRSRAVGRLLRRLRSARDRRRLGLPRLLQLPRELFCLLVFLLAHRQPAPGAKQPRTIEPRLHAQL